jgi:5-oxoprolinase (ATP-hydrolysing)
MAPGTPREPSWLIRVDTGGTFTDAWGRDPSGREHRCKILSSGVLRTAVEEVLGTHTLRLASGFGADNRLLEGFATDHGEVVESWDGSGRVVRFDRPHRRGAGALLELSSGEEAPVVAARLLTGTRIGSEFPALEFRLATTRGTNALLERKGEPGVLFVTRGFEDVLRIRDQRRPLLFEVQQAVAPPVFERTVGVGEQVGSNGEIVQELERTALAAAIAAARVEGFEVAAVALLNSYANPVHEELLGEMLAEAGFRHVSLSHQLTRAVRHLPRAETTAANAYLAPVMSGFVEAVRTEVGGKQFTMMTSAGALKPATGYRPIDSLLSGPAGGVAGALAAAGRAGLRKVLTFDMGGTSTDVARLEGAPGLRYEQEVGPVRVVAPAVRIETVAAGGGSVCRWRNGGLEVGPQSAGADPGPACYGRGGPLTITDVNLLLGCMDPSAGSIPLDAAASRRRLEELRDAMRRDGAEPGPARELLEGLREIAVERMADAIRKVSLREGYEPETYALVAFGGAGPQHACAVAEKLGVETIHIPGDAGLLSAWGLHRSAREELVEHQFLERLEECAPRFGPTLETMGAEARDRLGPEAVVSRYLLELRLVGQDAGIEVEFSGHPGWQEVRETFAERYETLYGYPIPAGREIELVAVRVVAAEPLPGLEEEAFAEFGPVKSERRILQNGFRTVVVDVDWQVAAGSHGSLMMRRAPAVRDDAPATWSAQVEAELFRCRFESVVEEMGELLRRTAISTNVKERLDYSCALLDGEGRLLVNAPHIPVHLGALGLCVREVSRHRAWGEGDMMVVNHPAYGGSHLPDITVISPVFVAGELLAFVANRAHHAEVGGQSPGSMPASAAHLVEEGVVIPPTLLFRSGQSRFETVEALFREALHPTRAIEDNLADLAAQAAANRHGVEAVRRMAREASREALAVNMGRLFCRAMDAIRRPLAEVRRVPRRPMRWMTAPRLRSGSAARRNTSWSTSRAAVPQHPGNLNATPAIVRSAVLYVLRLWVAEDLPLNEGLLSGVEIRIPRGILNPDFHEDPARCPAVVGGNVETSQRVVDVLLEALGLQAGSQGTMNNLLFGSPGFGYYETLGGGSGAGPGFDGLSGTHVHMSNTSITDPEILERRHPVRVREFGLRRNSGGAGRWQGGDGLVRELEFLAPLTVSLLTQRRLRPPRGAEGGEDGQPGRQLLVRNDGTREVLPPVTSFEVASGDRLRIETPGGGGWGRADPET